MLRCFIVLVSSHRISTQLIFSLTKTASPRPAKWLLRKTTPGRYQAWGLLTTYHRGLCAKVAPEGDHGDTRRAPDNTSPKSINFTNRNPAPLPAKRNVAYLDQPNCSRRGRRGIQYVCRAQTDHDRSWNNYATVMTHRKLVSQRARYGVRQSWPNNPLALHSQYNSRTTRLFRRRRWPSLRGRRLPRCMPRRTLKL